MSHVVKEIETVVKLDADQLFIVLEDIEVIQSHGIFVQSGIMIGFDSDDVDVFQGQLDFYDEAKISNTPEAFSNRCLGETARLYSSGGCGNL